MSSLHPDHLVNSLSIQAQELRIVALKTIFGAQSGHPGGSFSVAEIITALYFHHLRLEPSNPQWPERDRMIVSKGHCAPIFYACLAHRGFFPVEELKTFRKLNSRLQGHPDRVKIPGVEMPAGPLGHGLAVGTGAALAARCDRAKYRTYVLMGDGEAQAGLVWEAAMAAAHYRLDNLIAILDYNGFQLDGSIATTMSLEPLAAKWRAFGWRAIEIDGHNMRQILDALDAATRTHGKPTIIIAYTIKGKGVSFMEHTHAWHGKAPNQEQFDAALLELERTLVEIKHLAK